MLTYWLFQKIISFLIPLLNQFFREIKTIVIAKTQQHLILWNNLLFSWGELVQALVKDLLLPAIGLVSHSPPQISYYE